MTAIGLVETYRRIKTGQGREMSANAKALSVCLCPFYVVNPTYGEFRTLDSLENVNCHVANSGAVAFTFTVALGRADEGSPGSGLCLIRFFA